MRPTAMNTFGSFEPESLPWAIAWLVGLIIVLCLFWLLSERWNCSIIRRHVERNGQRFLCAKALLSLSKQHKYQVQYGDSQGAVYSAECIVHYFRVYMGKSILISPGRPVHRRDAIRPTVKARHAAQDGTEAHEMAHENARLLAENTRLAAELEKLRGNK